MLWFSERQTTVESSTFGSETVAMQIAVEMIEGLRYKLRMIGVPVDGPADVFCDDESAVKNAGRPESPLKKKHQAVSFHRIREGCASNTLRTAKEDTQTNVSDLFTKLLDGERLKELSSRCMSKETRKLQMISGDVGHSEARIDHGAQKTGNAKNQLSRISQEPAALALEALKLTPANNVCGCRTAVLVKHTILVLFVMNTCD